MINILIFHHTLFDRKVGSSEVLLQDIIKILKQSRDINLIVGFVVSERLDDLPEWTRDLKLIKFECDGLTNDYRSDFIKLSPSLDEIIECHKIDVYIGFTWADHQRHIRKIPNGTKLLLISPFGHYSSNGRDSYILVSGKKNYDRLKKIGIKKIKLFYNPLNIGQTTLKTKRSDKKVVFGRAGRDDPAIFDPISLRAYKILEAEYDADNIEFLYANPCDETRRLAQSLNLKSIKFLDWMTKEELTEFYRSIDVFAHSRLDGETLGISIAEAMLHGKCLVTHFTDKNNEQAFFAKSPFGFCVPQHDHHAYFLTMKYYVENRLHLEKFGVGARDYVRPLFDAEIVNKQLMILLDELMNENMISGAEYIKNSYRCIVHHVKHRAHILFKKNK